MRRQQIELWAHEIMDRVETYGKIEDDSVELKRDWYPGTFAMSGTYGPADVNKYARILAGHANAAQGEPILWLIGVDEKDGVMGFSGSVEYSNWCSELTSWFVDKLPRDTLVITRRGDKLIAAILFETDDAPYIVKVLGHGRNGVKAEHEVPWRANNRTRSANRVDLLRMLIPAQHVPAVDFLNYPLALVVNKNNEVFQWHLNVWLYLIPRNSRSLVIPFHRCSGEVEFPDSGETVDFKSLQLVGDNNQQIIESIGAQTIVRGTGQAYLRGQIETSRYEPSWSKLGVHCDIHILDALRPLHFDLLFERDEQRSPSINETRVAEYLLRNPQSIL